MKKNIVIGNFHKYSPKMLKKLKPLNKAVLTIGCLKNHTPFMKKIQNKPKNTKEKKLKYFGTLYGAKFYIEESDNETSDAISDYLKQCQKFHFGEGKLINDILSKQKQEIVEGIKNIEYSYTNYPTQMSSKKNYDRGNMAREICSAIIKELTQTKPN